MTAVNVAGQRTAMRVPFGPVPTWATDGDRVALGMAVAPEVLVFQDRASAPQTIEWDAAPKLVTDLDRTFGAERYRELVGEDSTVLPRWEVFALPDERPVMGDLMFDQEGNLWVEDYSSAMAGFPDLHRPRAGEEPQTWQVFNRAGHLVASFTAPSGFDVMDASGNLVTGVYRDQLDVEIVRSYLIVRE